MSWIAAGVASASMTVSGIKAYRAHKQLKELQKQAMPNYSISPEMQNAYGRAENMSRRGFTAAEEAAFKANLGQSSNTSYRQALDQSGGGMSQAILGGINSRNVAALNQFAGQDAALHRQNIQYSDQLAGQLQGQTNMATEQNIARRMEMERGYGKAVSDNITSAQSSANAGAQMMSGADFGKTGGPSAMPTYATGGAGANPPVADMNMYKSPGQQMYTVNKAPDSWPSPYQGQGLQPQQGGYMTQGIYGAQFGPQGMGPTGSYYAPYNYSQ